MVSHSAILSPYPVDVQSVKTEKGEGASKPQHVIHIWALSCLTNIIKRVSACYCLLQSIRIQVEWHLHDIVGAVCPTIS